MAVFVVRVERMSSSAILGRRMIGASVVATVTTTAAVRIHLVRFAPELPEPARKRSAASAADVRILSEIDAKRILQLEVSVVRRIFTTDRVSDRNVKVPANNARTVIITSRDTHARGSDGLTLAINNDNDNNNNN